MRKATWRFRSMAQTAARVVATAPSLAAAAVELDVDVATLHRWCREGKWHGPPGAVGRRVKQRPSRQPAVTRCAPGARRCASSMTSSHRARIADPGGTLLVLARDAALKPADQLAAMARFAALVKQLNLEIPDDGEVATTDPRARTWPRRAG